jgi:arabinan endo-1,5-alpha-L-arabinosidase
MYLVSLFRRSTRAARCCAVLALAAATLGLSSCSSGTTPGSAINLVTSPLSVYDLLGDVAPIHDPTIIRQGSNYYVLSTDGGQAGGFLPMFCSSDKITWKRCGQVFTTIPANLSTALGITVTSLWAPDVSYFNGLYHVYFTASAFGTNNSVIALATSPTMNPTDPNYQWTYQGIILQSPNDGSGYNAIDSNILVDTDSNGNLTHVWMTYGSFFKGIAQREINPANGQLLQAQSTAPTALATRPGVTNNPVEGASLVKHDGYYYLFASFDYCCNSNFTTDNYKIVVGRGTSPQGPFVDMSGTAMLNGGGTVLLQSAGEFTAPGGEDVLIDPTNGDLIAFHALSNTQNGYDYLFVKSLTWPNDWPVISN